jgi:hypothetical protein
MSCNASGSSFDATTMVSDKGIVFAHSSVPSSLVHEQSLKPSALSNSACRPDCYPSPPTMHINLFLFVSWCLFASAASLAMKRVSTHDDILSLLECTDHSSKAGPLAEASLADRNIPAGARSIHLDIKRDPTIRTPSTEDETIEEQKREARPNEPVADLEARIVLGGGGGRGGKRSEGDLEARIVRGGSGGRGGKRSEFDLESRIVRGGSGGRGGKRSPSGLETRIVRGSGGGRGG